MFSGKKPFVVAVSLLSLLGFAPYANSAHAKAAQELVWESDVDKVMEEGRHLNKYVLADVYTTWCVPCKKMDKTTFEDAGLRSFLNDHFVCLKVNAEDKGAGEKFAENNKVGMFPTSLVFTPQGKLLGKVTGFKTAEQFRNDLDALLQRAQ